MCVGSMIFRSSQFAVFESVYTRYMKDKWWTKETLMGPQRWIFLAGALAGVTRAVLECPFEYIKVRK